MTGLLGLETLTGGWGENMAKIGTLQNGWVGIPRNCVLV